MLLAPTDHPIRVYRRKARPDGTNGTLLENYSGINSIDGIDLPALAEEVYVLLKEELRLERERQGWYQGR